MALSEEEERILAELAKNLYSEDPKLARTMRDGTSNMSNAVFGVLSFLAGMSLLIAGVAVNFILLGVAGFVLMLFGSWLLYQRFASPTLASNGAAGPAKPARKRNKSFMDTVNDRWDRRRQEF